jgi:hypothetical protein
MKKPVMFCMRMSQTLRDALRKAAEKDHRSVSSFLHQIIADYLMREGFTLRDSRPDERRRFARKAVKLPCATGFGPGKPIEAADGRVVDVSLGGVLLAYPKDSRLKVPTLGELPDFEVSFQLPSTAEKICLNCNVRRMSDSGDEIHVGAVITGAGDDSLQTLKRYMQ